jgi:voltage-gated potassium channel
LTGEGDSPIPDAFDSLVTRRQADSTVPIRAQHRLHNRATTVGFGDITPQTPAGQVLASVLMIFGYGIIAVPTGIVSAEMTRAANKDRSCRSCGAGSRQKDAEYCRRCGHPLSSGTAPDR